ncbi:MAG: 3-phosphoglycerate dehydrogenase [Christensenellaceae bacterium]|nr:3-phosphoglycerate dehydrogenase [Christensenellaceae bacterium]
MFKIKLMNDISDVIYKELDAKNYLVSKDVEDPDAIIVRSADLHSMEFNPSLKAISRAGAGTNNIPIDACSKAGIAVFNTPGANSNAVAELVICAILLTSRNVVEAIDWVKSLEGEADVAKKVESGKKAFVGPETMGKKLAVIGLGATGINVANHAVKGLRMNVVGYDPYISVTNALKLSTSVKLVKEIAEAVEGADYITCHIPLSKKTENMFNKELFKFFKDGAYLYNFSRAELVNINDVKEALESKKIKKYVTDFPTDESVGVPGIINIPHLGASTPESEENCAEMASKELKEFLEFGQIQNSVNLPDVSFKFEEGLVLMIIHANVPNMVNSISAEISACKVNISSMINQSKKDMAVTVVDIENCACDNLQDRISKIENVYKVIRIK